MKKNILITGGFGFIGAHCIEKYYKENYNIHVVDNFSSNAIDACHPIANKCKLFKQNFLDFKQPEYIKYNTILHLASPVGPVGVLKYPGVMAKMILEDVYKAISVAQENDAILLFVSTSEIYGHREEKTYLTEDSDKVFHGEFTVRNEYAAAKLLSEMVIKNYAKKSSLRYQIIRPFNVTGKYQLPTGGFVLPRFVKQALTGEDITVYYSGEQIRAFTWINDIVEGIWLCENSHVLNEEWNIGNKNNEKSILYLAEQVKKLTNSKSNIIHVNPKDLHGELFSEAPEKIPDASKIENILNWKPTKNVDEVILEVIDFYKNI